MSNKSEAAWHPNIGPGDDHTDPMLTDLLRLDSGNYGRYRRGELGPGETTSWGQSDKRAWQAAEEIDEYEELCNRQAQILTGAVNALRGTPPVLTLWSHHDVTELVQALVAERDALAHVIKQVRRWQASRHDGAGWSYLALSALLDSDPAVLLAQHEAEMPHGEEERDKTRAERDAFAYVIDEARRVVGTADLRDFLDAAPTVSLARHDAEVKAQALDEAVADLLEQFPTYGTNGTTAGWLLDRSAAIRAEANDHSN